MSTIIATLKAIVSVDITQFDAGMRRANTGIAQLERNLDKASGASKRFGTALQVFAGNVLTNVAGKLLDAGRSAIKFAGDTADAASDIAESTSKVGVLLGASARQATDFAETSAKSYGISKSAALEYIGTFAGLMRSQGQARAAAAQYSVQLVKTAADLASFSNTSITEALDALRSGLTGESDPLKKFGVVANETAVQQEALRLGLVKTTKEISSQQKQLAILSIIKRQTAAASGDFARTADGAANSTRVLSARFDDLKAKVGEVTLPIKQRLIKIIQELFDYIDRNQGKIRTFFRGVGDHIQDAVDTGKALLTVFNALPDSVQQTAGSTAKLVAGFAPLAAVASNIAGMVVSFKQLKGVQAGVAGVGASVGDQLRRAEERMAAVAAAQTRGAVIEAADDAFGNVTRPSTAAINAQRNAAAATQAAAQITAQQTRTLQNVSQAYRDAAASGTKFAGVQAAFGAMGNNIKTIFAGIVASVAPFALSIGLIVAAISAAAIAWFALKAQIAKSQAEIARYQKAEITQDDVRRAAKGLPNNLEKVARNNAQTAIDDSQAQMDALKTKIATFEQDAAGLIARRAELQKQIAAGTDKVLPFNAKAQVVQLSSRLSEYDEAKAELAHQESRLKASQRTIAKLDKTEQKRTDTAIAKQAAQDLAKQQEEAREAAARAAREAAAQSAKEATESARKARESQFKSLVADVLAQRTKLKQLTAANKNELQVANLSELAGKYDKIDVKSGSAGKLASEYLRLADAIKRAENAAAEKARVTSALSGLYDTIRTKVLLLRDASLENSVAVEVFKKSYVSLSQAEKERIKGIIALQYEEKRLSTTEEQAKQAADEWKSKMDSLSDAHRDAGIELEKYKLHVEGVEDSTNPAILALERFKVPLETLPFLTRVIVIALAGLNKQLADLQAADAHAKKIKELANEYQSLLSAGSDWSKFLLQREGTDFEPGIDSMKLARLRDEFVALSNVAQARGLEGLRDRLRDLQIETGEVTLKTTEARIAWEQFHTSMDKLSPEIASEVAKLGKEFDRLNAKAKKLEAIREVGQTIKSVFANAFETVLTTGKGFFASLIQGFRQAIIRILAEKAAAAVAGGAEKLIGDLLGTNKKEGGGEGGDGKGSKSTYSSMRASLEDAKKTATPVVVQNAADLGSAQASQLAPLLSQFMPQASGGIPGTGGIGGGIGMGQMGAKFAAWAGSQLLGSAAGAATGGIYTVADTLTGGALTKGLGGLVKGVGKIFGFANGGVPPLGRASLVGERGPELFVPNQRGTVYTHEASRKILEGGSRGDTYNVQQMVFNDAADVKRMKDWNRQRTQRKLRLA